MDIKQHNIDFSYIAQEPTLRSDINYLISDILVSKNEYYRFDDLFEVVNDDKVDYRNLDVFEYVEIGDVSKTEDIFPVQLDVANQNELNANYFNKTLVSLNYC